MTHPTPDRRQAARRHRRIIVNNDGNDACGVPGAVTPETFLAQRTTGLADTHVDAIFYCSGVVNLYTHRSDETEPRGEIPRWSFARDLIEQGTDTLEQITAFGHGHGMEVFWSMRMNDTHDSGLPDRFTDWKRANPHLLMGEQGDKIPWRAEGDWPARWSALDYEQPEVRERIFRILRDVVTRYDLDGIELDFFRHPLYFRTQYRGEPVTQAECDLMSDLVRRIHALTEEVAARRGRPLLIAARVPDSVGYAKAIGLDVEAWLEQGLVDLLVGSGYFRLEPWSHFVALGRRHDVPVYACLSGSRFVAPDNTHVKLSLDAWRGEALSAWDAGVDGVYLFNVFDPTDPRFREFGDPEQLRRLNPPPQFVSGSHWRPNYWLKNGSRFGSPEWHAAAFGETAQPSSPGPTP